MLFGAILLGLITQTMAEEGSCAAGGCNRVLVITGGNKGIGLEAAMQVAEESSAPIGFSTIVLTVRSAEKGRVAVAAAAERSGRPASLFQFVVMDMEDHDSVRAAVRDLPPTIDALVMNAGTLGDGSHRLTSEGVTRVFAVNVLGHAVMLEGLLEAGKIATDGNARVIFSGSEVARGPWLFAGFQGPIYFERGKIESYLARPPTEGTYGVAVRRMHASYANAKLIGGLWLSQLARERPDVYFATVSPGGCFDTDAMLSSPQPLRFLANNPVVQSVMGLLGGAHSIATAAGRYVSALNDADFPQRFPSGSVVAGPCSFVPFYIGATGPLTNQQVCLPHFDDAELQAEAARAVRAAIAR